MRQNSLQSGTDLPVWMFLLIEVWQNLEELSTIFLSPDFHHSLYRREPLPWLDSRSRPNILKSVIQWYWYRSVVVLMVLVVRFPNCHGLGNLTMVLVAPQRVETVFEISDVICGKNLKYYNNRVFRSSKSHFQEVLSHVLIFHVYLYFPYTFICVKFALSWPFENPIYVDGSIRT